MDTLILDESKYEEFFKQVDEKKFLYYPIKKLNPLNSSIMKFFCEFFANELEGFTGVFTSNIYTSNKEEKYFFTNGKFGSDTGPTFISCLGSKYYIVDEKIVPKKTWEARKAYCGTSLKSFPTKLNLKTDSYKETFLLYGENMKVCISQNGIHIIQKGDDISILHPAFVFERRMTKLINQFKVSNPLFTIKELNPQEMENKYLEYIKEFV